MTIVKGASGRFDDAETNDQASRQQGEGEQAEQPAQERKISIHRAPFEWVQVADLAD